VPVLLLFARPNHGVRSTVADLLDQLPASEPLPVAKLEKALRLSLKGDKEQLRISLEAMGRLGLLDLGDSGVQRLNNDSLIPARLRCSSKGFVLPYAKTVARTSTSVITSSMRAWNGDRAPRASITREGGRRRSPEGGVQCILSRTTTKPAGPVGSAG
jgi:ribonuclease R